MEQIACNFLSIPNVAQCRATKTFGVSFDDHTTGSTIPSEIGLMTQMRLSCHSPLTDWLGLCHRFSHASRCWLIWVSSTLIDWNYTVILVKPDAAAIFVILRESYEWNHSLILFWIHAADIFVFCDYWILWKNYSILPLFSGRVIIWLWWYYQIQLLQLRTSWMLCLWCLADARQLTCLRGRSVTPFL